MIRDYDGLIGAVLAWLALLLAVAVGCAGASGATRERYAAKVAECIAAEREIVARERGDDPSDDEEIDLALAEVRGRCDRELEEIER